MNTGKLDYMVSICVSIFAFFLIFSSSNAGYNILLGLLVLLGIYRLYKRQWHIERPSIVVIGLFAIFAISLLISAFYHGGTTLYSTWKYLYWALPFIPLYIGYVKDKTELAFFTGSSMALLALSIKGWEQIYDVFYGMTAVKDMMVKDLRITSLFASPNGFGQIVEMALPITIVAMIWSYQKYKETKHWVYIFSILWQLAVTLIAVVPFMGTISRGAILGFVAGGLIVAFIYVTKSLFRFYKRVFLLLLCVGIVGGGSYIINDHIEKGELPILPWQQMEASLPSDIPAKLWKEELLSITESNDIARSYDVQRIYMWKSSYQMWKEHKWMGIGFDQWQYQYENHYILPEATERSMPMPHNNVMFFLSTTGLVGFIGYAIFTVGIFGWSIYKVYSDKDGIVIAMFVWAFTALTIHGQVDSGITNKFAMHVIFGILAVSSAYIVNRNRIDEHNT